MPAVDGLEGVPTIFTYRGPEDDTTPQGVRVELISMEQRAFGVVWLRYRFHKA